MFEKKAQKKENATVRVRLFPSTHRKLRIHAAEICKTLAEAIDALVGNAKGKGATLKG